MESNTKTLLSLIENKDGNFDCVWDDPIKVATALALVIAYAGNADELRKIILLALATHFAFDEDLLEPFVAQLRMETEKMKRAIEKHEKLSKGEE